MAIQIGVVKAMTGSVTATAADGSIRNLQIGDRVFANELIATGADGAIEIEFADGTVMDLGRDSQAMLDSDVYDPDAAAAATAEAETVPDDIAAIQQALLEGEDPTTVGEATAAGAGVEGGNEGHEPVFVDYLNPAVIPDAGFDTIGVANEYDQPEEDIIILEEEDGSPSTGGTDVFVDEDDLGSEFELAFIGPSAIISAFEIDTGFIAQLPFVFGNNDEAPGDDLPPDSSTTQTGKLNASFGSDGPGSVKFNPEGDQPGGLTSGGEPILFWVSADGALLVGYILKTPDYDYEFDYVQEYGDYAEVIFTAELDPLTMNFAFTLHGPLDHPDGSTEDNLLINLSYVVSDSDGDTADGILKINVDDDSPLVELSFNEKTEVPLSLIVDESEGTDGSVKDEPGFADNDDETVSADPTDIGFATLSGEVLFDVDVDPGADGEDYDARTFALTLALPDGESEVDSGLDATDGGDIMLSWETVGSVIVGTDEDGHVVFRISMDAETGDVTVSQYEAIHHGDDENDHDALISMDEGLIGANVTVFDNDGDSVTSDDVDLGSLVGFEDDGPDQTVEANAEAAAALAVELDETEGDDRGNASIPEVADGNSDDAGPGLAQVTTAVTGGLAALFTASGSYGSDGSGMVSDSLSFIGVPDEGLATSLSATDGGAITLFLEGGDLVGRDTDNHIVFTVAIVESPADSGEYQLQTTLFEAIDHGDDGDLFDAVTQLMLEGEGEVQLEYEVTRTDGDGDEVTASDAITLINANGSVFSFDDDGPIQTVTADVNAAAALAVELDESEGGDRANANIAEVADGNTDDAGPGLAQVTTDVDGGLVTLFSASGDDGSDGPGSLSDALSFVGVPDEGLATTLSATDGGPITVFLEGGDLVGRDGDNHIVFTVEIVESPPASGEYQLQTTLYEAIDHGDDGNLFDSVTQLLLAEEGEVQLQYEVTRTDGDGDEVIASDQITLFDENNSVFGFDDDGPVAMDDSGNVSEGSTLNVASGSGVLINDDSGSDGYDGAIVGVVIGNDDTTDTINGNVGFTINGLYGTLKLNADGSYTYESTANAVDANAQDQFVYTIRDGDGDLTSAVLTINVADVSVDPTTTFGSVDEAGLAAGGNVPADGTDEPSDSEIFNGNLTLQPGWTAVPTSGSTLLGDYQVNADGTFSYTLTSVTDDVGGAETDSFTYTADDGNGNTVINTVTITIIDDEPIAYDDTNSVTEGSSVGGNVLTDGTDDIFGADGADAAGGVVGVAAGDTGSNLDDDSTLGGTGIAGTYGTLILNANGTYTYSVDADSIDADAEDVFTYTIKDADGDLTTATLTIDVANVTVTASDTEALVNEAGLDSGSLADDSDIYNGSITPAGGTGPYTYTLTSSADGAYGSLVLNPDGSYTYTLDTAYDTTPDANDGTNVEQDRDSFTYQVEDANGNTTTGTIYVDIIDDVPSITTGDVDLSGLALQTSDAATVFGVGVATADVDFAVKFADAVTANYGADGAGSTVIDNYTLSVVPLNGATGLTSGGQAITLYDIGGVIYASTAANAGAVDNTNTVLTFEVDTDGLVTLTQFMPVDHLGVGNDDVITLPLDLVNLSADVTVTDGDGDVTTETLDTNLNFEISVLDDNAFFTLVNQAPGDDVASLVTSNPTVDTTYHGNFADWSFGADGAGDFLTTLPGTLPPGVELDGSSTEEQIILNFYEGTGDSAVLVATLTLNADGEDSLDVFRREPEIEFIPIAATLAEAGGPVASLLVDLDGLGFDIIVSGSDGDGVPAEADDLVNTSTQGWAVKGSSGQTNEFNESIKFSFVDDGTLDPNANQYGVKDFKFTTQGYTGGLAVASVLVTIQFVDASDGNAVKTDTIALELTSGQQVRVTDLDWGAGVNDFTAGDDIYSVTILSQETDGSYRLNGIEVGDESITPPADLSYDFTLPINDSDGDTDSQSFNLSIAGETADGLTVEAITGTSGDDILVGTTGDDILIGGLGDDTMTGDTGADTFVINTVHLGTPDDVAADIITDFNEGEGDVLDLSDVLASGNTIEGVDNGGHLQIQVLDAEANVVQTIDLNTVNITTNATDALNALLGSGAVDDGV